MNRRNWLKTLGKGVAGALGAVAGARLISATSKRQILHITIPNANALSKRHDQAQVRRRVLALNEEFKKTEHAAKISGRSLDELSSALKQFNAQMERAARQ